MNEKSPSCFECTTNLNFWTWFTMHLKSYIKPNSKWIEYKTTQHNTRQQDLRWRSHTKHEHVRNKMNAKYRFSSYLQLFSVKWLLTIFMPFFHLCPSMLFLFSRQNRRCLCAKSDSRTQNWKKKKIKKWMVTSGYNQPQLLTTTDIH